MSVIINSIVLNETIEVQHLRLPTFNVGMLSCNEFPELPRCNECNEPPPSRRPDGGYTEHSCPLANLDKWEKIASLDDWPCEGPVSLQLFVTPKATRRFHSIDKYDYILIANLGAIWHNGVEVHSHWNRQEFLRFNTEDFIENEDFKLFEPRIACMTVHGRSYRIKPSNDFDSSFLCFSLARSIALSNEFKRSRRFCDGQIDIKFSKGVVDAHDMDASAIGLFGHVQELERLANVFQKIVEDMKEDRADSLIVLPVVEIIGKSETDILAYLCRLAGLVGKPPKGCKIQNSLKSCVISHIHDNKRVTRHGTPTPLYDFLRLECLKDSTIGVLVTFKQYKNRDRYGYNIYFDIPGGKIELAETPLECAFRELYEEAGINFDDQSDIGIRPKPFAGEEKNWELIFHDQVSVNGYYILHKDCKEILHIPLADDVWVRGATIAADNQSSSRSSDIRKHEDSSRSNENRKQKGSSATYSKEAPYSSRDNSLRRKIPCPFFFKSSCRYGINCHNSHDEADRPLRR